MLGAIIKITNNILIYKDFFVAISGSAKNLRVSLFLNKQMIPAIIENQILIINNIGIVPTTFSTFVSNLNTLNTINPATASVGIEIKNITKVYKIVSLKVLEYINFKTIGIKIIVNIEFINDKLIGINNLARVPYMLKINV
ncbi:MAG: hypothetical protein IKK43_02040 [Clostridia bacterium]|nr:hypothetical protein [Clostridia bacterium]